METIGIGVQFRGDNLLEGQSLGLGCLSAPDDRSTRKSRKTSADVMTFRSMEKIPSISLSPNFGIKSLLE